MSVPVRASLLLFSLPVWKPVSTRTPPCGKPRIPLLSPGSAPLPPSRQGLGCRQMPLWEGWAPSPGCLESIRIPIHLIHTSYTCLHMGFMFSPGCYWSLATAGVEGEHTCQCPAAASVTVEMGDLGLPLSVSFSCVAGWPWSPC